MVIYEWSNLAQRKPLRRLIQNGTARPIMTEARDGRLGEMEKWISICDAIAGEQSPSDASHDISHCRRVWRLSLAIMARDAIEADLLVLMAAAYFHDIRNYPKNSSLRELTSTHSADRAVELLSCHGFPPEKTAKLHHAIAAHSFSAGIPPTSNEARIVQDADRIEALGAIGLARAFAVGSTLGANLFDPDDPLAESRSLNDRRFTLDHFQTKLFHLPDKMNTRAGREIAERRVLVLRDFVSNLMNELHLADVDSAA